jgi:uncharacterized membrane protein
MLRDYTRTMPFRGNGLMTGFFIGMILGAVVALLLVAFLFATVLLKATE